ncbi:MAG: FimV/HubP family polar landmark protein [Pseudomonadota bacterium]
MANFKLAANRPSSQPTPKVASMLSFLNTRLVVTTIVTLFFSTNLAALGLGALKVESNLDEPLNGTIELRVSDGDDLDTVSAAIASEEDFANLGIEYPSYLNDLSLSLEQNGSQTLLRVVSNDVIIKEPFIHFLIRVDWAGGSFLREYTALIDPPVYASETPQSVSQPRSVGVDQSYLPEETAEIEVQDLDESEVVDEVFGDSSAESVYDESIYSEESEPVAVEEEVSTESFADSDFDSAVEDDQSYVELATDAQYGPVASGESLSVIAEELQRQFPDLSIYQIMQVLFEENRDAFIDDNINGLMRGTVLNIGDLNAIRAVDIAQAKQFFYDQVSEWDPSVLIASSSSGDGLLVGQDQYTYDDDLLGGTSSSSSDFQQDNFQVGSSTDTESFVSSAEGDNREAEMVALREQIIELQSSLSSSTLENQELTERISILEGQLADMNRLLSLDVESAEMASVEATLAAQNDNSDVTADVGTDDGSATDLVDQVDAMLADMTADGSLGDAGTDTGSVIDDLGSNDLDSDELAGSAIESDDFGTGDLAIGDDTLGEVGDLDQPIGADSIDAGADSDTTAAAQPRTITPISQPGILEQIKTSLIDDGLWKILAGVGALLAAGFGLLMIRRRRADEEFEISMLSIETQSQSVDQESVTATPVIETPSKAPDRETSFLTVYSDSDAVVQADEVDPIAEADVYIAYGRDEQAEEVLLDGIAGKPGRVDIKQKLLALYHKNNNVEGFERIAEELYSQKNFLTSQIWQEVSLMGKDISPNNPLFEVSASEILADELVADESDSAADDGSEAAAETSAEEADDTLAYTGADDAPDAAADDSETVMAETADSDEDEQDTEVDTEIDSGDIVDLDLEADSDGELDLSDEMAVADSASQASDWSVDDSIDAAEESVDFALAEEEHSVNLISFDDGRSEISELDDIEIDALEFDDDDVAAVDDAAEDILAENSDDEVLEEIVSSSDEEKGEALEFERIDVPEGDDEDSLRAAQEVSDLEVDEDYDESRTQYELAKVFVDLGDEDGARKILDDIVSNDDVAEDVLADASELLQSINA